MRRMEREAPADTGTGVTEAEAEEEEDAALPYAAAAYVLFAVSYLWFVVVFLFSNRLRPFASLVS